MLSFVIVVKSVMSDTPTCFFLKPSFQSACKHSRVERAGNDTHGLRVRTLATLPAAALFLGVAAAPFLPAFLDGAWEVGAFKMRREELPANTTHHNSETRWDKQGD